MLTGGISVSLIKAFSTLHRGHRLFRKRIQKFIFREMNILLVSSDETLTVKEGKLAESLLFQRHCP